MLNIILIDWINKIFYAISLKIKLLAVKEVLNMNKQYNATYFFYLFRFYTADKKYLLVLYLVGNLLCIFLCFKCRKLNVLDKFYRFKEMQDGREYYKANKPYLVD